MHFVKYFLLSFLFPFWIACANIMAPTGGDKDTTAPKMISRSLKDSSVNFKGGNIEFIFDEFIQLKDLQKQLLISPLLKEKPIISAHKRKLNIFIADSLLLDNTTYRVSLGNAIQDMHEGNPYDNLGFTFSTANYFDSLEIDGKVFDAQTGQPDTSVVIVLYDAQVPDSIFKKQKPLYVVKPNGESFRFMNMPQRSFKIFALQDANQNLMYDLPTEKLAFLDQIISPNNPSNKITLYTFIEADARDTSKLGMRRGMTNTNTKNAKLNYQVNIDTSKKQQRNFELTDSIVISFTQKIKNFDISKVRLSQQEILDATAQINLDSSATKIIIKTDWVADASYTLQLRKGFIIDSSDTKADSALFHIKTKRLIDYGFASLIVEKKENNWLELTDGEKIIARKPANDTLVKFELLKPATYHVRILHDKNKNGKWDSGNYSKGIQPEIVERLPQEILIKANWENKINLTEKLKPKRER